MAKGNPPTRSARFDAADFRGRKQANPPMPASDSIAFDQPSIPTSVQADKAGQERNYAAGYWHGLFLRAGNAEIRAVTGEAGYEEFFSQGENDGYQGRPPQLASEDLLRAYLDAKAAELPPEKPITKANPNTAVPKPTARAKPAAADKPSMKQTVRTSAAPQQDPAPPKQKDEEPARLSDAQIVINVKARLRAAALKIVPEYLLALIADTQPSPQELKRYNDYKATVGFLRAAEAIEGAVTAVVTAINPLAGAIVGVAVAGTAATQEMVAKDIDNYVAPWTLKNSGLTGDFAVKSMQRIVYSYRGFTSINYGSAPNRIYGIRLDNKAKQEEFDDYIDGLLEATAKVLQIPLFRRYFCVNQVTETLDWEDRDNEKRDNYRGRVVAQYLPAELEKIMAEIRTPKN